MDRQPLDEFTAVQRALVKEARSKLLNTYSTFKDKDPAVLHQILAHTYVKLVHDYGDAVAAQAAAMYEQLRPGSLGLFTAEVADQYTEKQLTAKAIEITRAADPIKYASGELQKALVGMGRRTVKHNMRRDKAKPRWARVPAGAKTCAFCTMLASRGWVYSDEETAGGAGNRFHADCDCMILPSWDKGTPRLAGYDPDGMYEQYKDARKAAEADVEAGKAKRVDDSLILQKMRENNPLALTDTKVPAELSSKEAGWPADEFVAVSVKKYIHIFERHEAKGTAVDIFDDPSPKSVAEMLQLTLRDPTYIFPHKDWRNVEVYYLELGEKVFRADVDVSKLESGGKKRVNTFYQTHKDSPAWEELRAWKAELGR